VKDSRTTSAAVRFEVPTLPAGAKSIPSIGQTSPSLCPLTGASG